MVPAVLHKDEFKCISHYTAMVMEKTCLFVSDKKALELDSQQKHKRAAFPLMSVFTVY